MKDKVCRSLLKGVCVVFGVVFVFSTQAFSQQVDSQAGATIVTQSTRALTPSERGTYTGLGLSKNQFKVGFGLDFGSQLLIFNEDFFLGSGTFNDWTAYGVLRLHLWMAYKGHSEAFNFYMKGHALGAYSKDNAAKEETFSIGFSPLGFDVFQGLSLWAGLEDFYLLGRVPVGSSGGFVYQLGRFKKSDISYYILDNEILDGFFFGFDAALPSAGHFIFSLYGGFSGLVDKRYSSLWVNPADVYNLTDNSIYLANPKAVGMGTFGFTELGSLRTSVVLEYVVQYDLLRLLGGTALWNSSATFLEFVNENFDGAPRTSDPLITYATLKLEGYLGLNWFKYKLGGSYQLTLGRGGVYSNSDQSFYHEKSTQAFIVFGELSFIFEEEDNPSSLHLRGFYSSGDSREVRATFDLDNSLVSSDASLLQGFFGLSRPYLSNIFTLYSLQNLSMSEVEYILTHKEVFEWNLAARAYIRSKNGPVDTLRIIFGDVDNPYLGTEIETIFKYRYLDNLVINFSLGIFLPNPVDYNYFGVGYITVAQFILSYTI